MEAKEMINYILNNSDINQKQLADKIKVSPAQITRWRDDAEPKRENFRKLEEIYKSLIA